MNLSVGLSIPLCMSKPQPSSGSYFSRSLKLPTVTQKAAKSPSGRHSYAAQHHLSYLGLSWASLLHLYLPFALHRLH